MKPRIIATVILLGFVAVSILFIILKERRREAPTSRTKNENASQLSRTPTTNTGTAGNEPATASREGGGASAPAVSDGIIVYYFHATRRCATCRAFEEYTREAVTNGFPDEMKDGTLVWCVVNVDEPASEHYVSDYRLTTKSVVLAHMNDGKVVRWKNLPRIWDLVGDKATFIAYIQGEISDFRKGI